DEGEREGERDEIGPAQAGRRDGAAHGRQHERDEDDAAGERGPERRRRAVRERFRHGPAQASTVLSARATCSASSSVSAGSPGLASDSAPSRSASGYPPSPSARWAGRNTGRRAATPRAARASRTAAGSRSSPSTKR